LLIPAQVSFESPERFYTISLYRIWWSKMMLPDWKIRKEILIDPFYEKSLQPAGYDLRVGREAYINGRLIDVEKEGKIVIPPKTHALVLTLEPVSYTHLTLPTIA
jgi:deoxycytidine triphosphate deaminase